MGTTVEIRPFHVDCVPGPVPRRGKQGVSEAQETTSTASATVIEDASIRPQGDPDV